MKRERRGAVAIDRVHPARSERMVQLGFEVRRILCIDDGMYVKGKRHRRALERH
jgi:hypothetical protein